MVGLAIARPDAARAEARPVGLRVVERFQGRLVLFVPSAVPVAPPLSDNTEPVWSDWRMPKLFGEEDSMVGVDVESDLGTGC
jgi:hypothetical protein